MVASGSPSDLLVNADFTRPVVVHAARLPWVASPAAGIERRMLDRVGGEVARATSLVRYAAGSRFPAHTHDGGEEFLVLEGVFQDEGGDYGPGSYVRNPPGSRHAPGSATGCVIFVKLRQFPPDDDVALHLDTGMLPDLADPLRPGVAIKPLHASRHEQVRLERWPAGVSAGLTGRAELLVLAGDATLGGEHLDPWSWLRLPEGKATLHTEAGCQVWIKQLAPDPQVQSSPATVK